MKTFKVENKRKKKEKKLLYLIKMTILSKKIKKLNKKK
jgi:hypothetical protein